LEQAILVARDNDIDINENERWSQAERKLSGFRQIQALLV